MKVTITLEDNGEITEASADLDKYLAVPPALRMLTVILGQPLAHTYFLCVSAGINVLVREYTQVELEARKAELRQVMGY